VTAEACAHPLPARQLRIGFREGAPAGLAAVAALAPAERRSPAGDRQVAHAHGRSLFHLHARPATGRACGGGHDELDLEVELVASLSHRRYGKAVQAEQSAKFLQHPLFLLAPRSLTTQSVVRAADVLSS